jgi:hypothetical protein
MTDLFEARLTYLRDWWAKHGNTVDFDTADDWINSMTNVELLCTLSWAKHEKPPVDRKLLCAREAMAENAETGVASEWGGKFRSGNYDVTYHITVPLRAIELWEEGFGK